jgi:hypothetical protein
MKQYRLSFFPPEQVYLTNVLVLFIDIANISPTHHALDLASNSLLNATSLSIVNVSEMSWTKRKHDNYATVFLVLLPPIRHSRAGALLS